MKTLFKDNLETLTTPGMKECSRSRKTMDNCGKDHGRPLKRQFGVRSRSLRYRVYLSDK
jgi:hypothetical protein